MKVSKLNVTIGFVLCSAMLACGKKGEENTTSQKFPEFQFAKGNVGVWGDKNCMEKKEVSICKGLLITDSGVEGIQLEKVASPVASADEPTTDPAVGSSSENMVNTRKEKSENNKVTEPQKTEEVLAFKITEMDVPLIIRIGKSPNFEVVSKNTTEKAELWNKKEASVVRVSLMRSSEFIILSSIEVANKEPYSEYGSYEEVYQPLAEATDGTWRPDLTKNINEETIAAIGSSSSEKTESISAWKELQRKAQQADEEAQARSNREQARKKDPCQSNPLVRELVCRRR